MRPAARTATAARGELESGLQRGTAAAAAAACSPMRPHPCPSSTPPHAAAAQRQQLALSFHPSADTTISFPLRADEARRLSEALAGVMQTFAEKQAAERPKRWPSMEYKFKGEGRAGATLGSRVRS